MTSTAQSPPARPKRRKWLKRVLIVLLAVAAALVITIIVRSKLDARIDYDVSTDSITIPQFSTVDIDFKHNYAAETSIESTAGAVLNLDNDGAEELFLGGGEGQQDAIFRFVDGAFVDITASSGLRKATDEATMSAVSLDVDGNGFDDLIVTTTTAIWLYSNADGKLSGRRLAAPLADDTTPLSVAVADLNRDGHFDMYVSGYIRKEKIEGLNIFNKEGYGGTSALLINRGDNTFIDRTQDAGLFYKHNTFQSVFIDVDGDGLEDLVVAHDTGQVRTWKNLGGLKFEAVPNPNSEVYGYPMGIAVSDYDNDGRCDFFFSNTGTTAPSFLAKGDLRDDQIYHPQWLMFHNEGNFKFTDSADTVKVANYEFSWGAVFEDFNLDGRPDLVVSENYVGFPPHKFAFLRLPGRFLVQNTQGEFAAVGAEAGVENKRFGIAPLTADFNLDGAPDLVHVNLAGASQAFLSQNAPSHYVKVKLPNTVRSIGAMVHAKLSDGRTLHRPFVKGEGLCSDSTPIITLGTGGAEVIELSVTYLGQEAVRCPAPKLGSTVAAPAPPAK